MPTAPSPVTGLMTEAMPALAALPAPPPCARRFPGQIPMLSVVTLVLWVSCVVIGGLGLTLPYARPVPNLPAAAPVQAEILKVELTAATVPVHSLEPRPTDLPSPPSPPEPAVVAPPPAAAMIAVTEPIPALAFPLPVEGPVRLVEPALASHAPEPSRVARETSVSVPVRALAYGEGEGRQPGPDYPRQAVRERQEGAVTVRFSVGENGRVVATETVSAAPWPLLNESALRVIRERWRFRPGPPRLYEVTIRFELKDRRP